MRWKSGRRSENVEDRRGMRPSGGMVKLGGGFGALLIIGLVLISGGNLNDVLKVLQNAPPPGAGGGGPQVDGGVPLDDPKEAERVEFVRVVLGDTEDVWNELFAQAGHDYREPKLILFRGSVDSACGSASASTGPFYCPADEQVYIDLSFYDDLADRFGAPGDFAQAYVIAHEIGHHIQNQLGISDRIHQMQQQVSEEEGNDLSVRLELQADFFAGVWAHHAQKVRNILEEGDIDEALNAASEIGDDRLQMEAQGYVVPEKFTHGTSAQRQKWFRKGFQTGDINQGDTFSARDL